MNNNASTDLARDRQVVQIIWSAFLGSLAVASAVLLCLHRPAVWPFEAVAGGPAC